MTESELGDWRRTHYSNELKALDENSDVTVMGWIVSVRGHGNISFATIHDRIGEIQIVAKSGDCPADVKENIALLKIHSSIAIIGKTKYSEKSPTGVEIIPSQLKVLSLIHI